MKLKRLLCKLLDKHFKRKRALIESSTSVAGVLSMRQLFIFLKQIPARARATRFQPKRGCKCMLLEEQLH